MSRKLGFLVIAVFAVVLGAGTAAGLASVGSEAPGPPPTSIGVRMDRPLTPTLINATFTDQSGEPVQLSAFAGEVVFLVPFLTSCQEECPVTTGALLTIERALAAERLGSRVALVEVTVDPHRDTSERLKAYARLTGVTWTLLTAPPSTIAALWHYYGIYYQEVPEGNPPGIDWQSGKPYAYDVDHSDGFILLDSHLRERFVAAGMARPAHLSATVLRLLNAQGLHDLKHPGTGSWTIPQALQAIGWILGRPVGG